jgi:hypothetical protein
MGISHLSEWDVLAFVYRHGASLFTTAHIARFTGLELAEVGRALDRLEGDKLIEQTPSSRGVSFYRIAPSMAYGRQRTLQQLIDLSESRAGRMLLEDQLSPVNRNRGGKKQRPESEGKWLCLKAI